LRISKPRFNTELNQTVSNTGSLLSRMAMVSAMDSDA
jgi:hypothetical protein